MLSIIAVILMLPLFNAPPETAICELSTVEWRDAVMYMKTPLDFAQLDDLTVNTISIGCVLKTEKTVIVINTVSAGVSMAYMAIPKDWVQKITPLKVAAEEKK